MKKTRKTKRRTDPKKDKKDQSEKGEENDQELDHDSTTPDPSQPDTEIGHEKKHKIIFNNKTNKPKQI